ncbi:hypothetical protein OIU85_005530 [Salix viminalis]|uniref:Uncharacterized protein n=1 Tax=Salix viminalis TaxID=40686 RepID=A0A9Q0STQ0_SALVM|nr:hypothetical protein OIU85_005530 [Salix viminalis]
MEEKCKSQDRRRLSPEIRQLGAVGAVKVAVRSLSIDGRSCIRKWFLYMKDILKSHQLQTWWSELWILRSQQLC